MPTQSLGFVSLAPRGEWDASTTYKRLDTVSYGGSSYIVLRTVTGIIPSNNNVDYTLLASKGGKGNKGDDAFKVWSLQPGNEGKTYADYEAWLRQPATDAALEANNAAAVAKVATENAKIITGEAQEATNNAILATNNLESIKSDCITATDNANTAASEARISSNDARDKAEAAREATTKAQEATNDAIQATTKASESTQEAKEAAQEAREAAQRANDEADVINNKLDKTGDGESVYVTFDEVAPRSNVASGDKLSVLFGKIKRWFSDLKTVAFTGKASDLSQDAGNRLVTDTEKAGWNDKYTRAEVDNKDADGLQAAKEYAVQKIAELVNGSPAALDTLQELAAALGNDPNFATSIMALIGGKADTVHTHTKVQITDFPAALPANGGNADTVDGVHAAAVGKIEGSKLVSYDEGGCIAATYYLQDSPNNENIAISQVIFTNGTDTAFRKASLSHLKSSLGSMPANGGNADTVDGVHAYEFSGLEVTAEPSTPNTIYKWKSASTPSGCYGTCLVFNPGTLNKLFIADSGNNPMYYKTAAGSWKRFAMADEIPASLPANGGNADTVDRLHATDFGRAYSGYYDFGGNNNDITTAAFVNLLESLGAFNHPYWVARGSWDYARNNVISDTGIGRIHLSGCTVEVCGKREAFTIRITTPTTDDAGAELRRVFIYINNHDGYSPGWFKLANISDIPTSLPANGGNADTVGGRRVAVQSVYITPSQLYNNIPVYTDAGYLNAVIFKDSWVVEDSNTISDICYRISKADGYHRWCSLARLKSVLGSMPASDVPAWAKQANKPTYNINEIFDANAVLVDDGTVNRKIFIANYKSEGYLSRAAIGLTNPSALYSPVIISAGMDDQGNTWADWVFDPANGRITNPNGKAFAYTEEIPNVSNYLPLSGGAMSGMLSTCMMPGTFIEGMTRAAIKYNNLAPITDVAYHSFFAMKAQDNHVLNFGGIGNHIGFRGYLRGHTENSYDYQLSCNTADGSWTLENGRFYLNGSAPEHVIMFRNNAVNSGYIGFGAYPTKDLQIMNYATGKYISIAADGKLYYDNKEIATVDQITGGTIPDASTSVSGIVNTGAQTFAGTKTFIAGIDISAGGMTVNGGMTVTNGPIACTGEISAALGFFVSSDIRLKTNIEKIRLSESRIRLCEFDKADKHSYGVIAQEVEELYPTTVKEENGYKVVNYIEVLTIKCAEQDERIEALERENSSLKERLERLEKLLLKI